MFTKKALAASVSAPPAVYIEDVFSTYLYAGDGSLSRTITNGIDLEGKGGLVWIKGRNSADNHLLVDTNRGVINALSSVLNNGTIGTNAGLSAVTSSGFITSSTSAGNFGQNDTGKNLASWTFRKAEKFFDVVTYTGTGSNRTIAHNLGSVPGCIIVKRTDTTGDWQVYHRSLANTEYMVLNSTAAKATGTTRWNSTTPTSSVFSLGTDATVNASGGTYVAYLFAHDAGGFGDAGDQSVVKCGSYSATNANGNFVSLGWEPQFVIIKNAARAANWSILDDMRGVVVSSQNDTALYPNLSGAESSPGNLIDFNATGFTLNSGSDLTNGFTNDTFIYIAIRRGPMKTPTDATKVFTAITSTNNDVALTTGFPADMLMDRRRDVANSWNTLIGSRLVGRNGLISSSTGTEQVNAFGANCWDSNTSVTPVGLDNGSLIDYAFRRAPGFFDVVAYTGTGSARTVSHNLSVVPELMIVKSRAVGNNWGVWHSSFSSSEYINLNLNSAKNSAATVWNGVPSTTTFSLGASTLTNSSGQTYIAYLFASAPGVSKVGSYTGTGTTLDIDCGFTAGARFVLVKRTDSTGDWFVWDTARGIVSGNDPYLLLNSTAAEVTSTDYIDPLSSGFQISSTAPAAINASGGSFIFLAIA